MDSVFDTINGLPLHPLVVHAVVVLLPLAALGAILMAAWPSFSRRFGIIVVILSLAAVPAAFVAKESGERLALRVGTPQDHADLGKWLVFFAFGMFVITLVFWLFDRGIPSNRSRPGWLIALGVLLIIVALATMWWTVRVGDSGARAVWEPIMQRTSR